jgi:hypothetical protein
MDDDDESVHVGSTIRIFVKQARKHETAAVNAHPEILGLIETLNGAFNSLTNLAVNGPALPALLLLDSHASFLCAVRSALSGQIPVVSMALRGSIESGLYGLIMSRDKSTEQAWIGRETDRGLCRRTFSASRGLALLREVDPDFAQFLHESYEIAIDNGAHPNFPSIKGQIMLDEYDRANKISHIYLHTHEATPVVTALRTCVETGMAIASLFRHILPKHPPALEADRTARQVYFAYQTYRDKAVDSVGALNSNAQR